MKNFDLFKFFRVWMVSLLGIDFMMVLFLFISGRILGEIYSGDFLIGVSFIIIVLSIVVGFGSIIYSFVKKNYKYIAIGIGILFGTVLLYLAVLIIAISQIF